MSEKFNPEMLKLARYARKLTQSALARELNIKPSFISQIEAGIVDMPNELLDKIVVKTDFPKRFFEQNTTFLDGCSKMYRAKKSLKSKDIDYFDTYASFYNSDISKLLDADVFDKDTFKLIESRAHPYNTPEKIANSLREYWNIPRGVINNLTQILENKGIFIIPISVNNSDFDATFYINEKNDFAIILINSNVPPDRYRFNLAHELGHIIMHRVPSPNCEKEAHEFASAFLMPKKDIEADLSGISFWDLTILKEKWKVSMSALTMRAKKLNKISEEKSNIIFKQLSYYGYRKEEPLCNIPKEKPMVIKYLINHYLEELNYSKEKLCFFLRISSKEYNIRYGKILGNYYTEPQNKPLRLVN